MRRRASAFRRRALALLLGEFAEFLVAEHAEGLGVELRDADEEGLGRQTFFPRLILSHLSRELRDLRGLLSWQLRVPSYSYN